MSVLALLFPVCLAFLPPKQATLLEQPTADPVTEALVTYVSMYSTPEGQLAAGMELLNTDIAQASEQFYQETSFLLEELEQAIELVGDAVVTVLDDEIFEREFDLEDVRGEIQEVMMQLNDATGTCEQYPSCLSCSQDQACIWCTLLGRCVVGDQYGALNNECQDFSYRECPALPCAQYPTCLQCLTDASCAWCELEGMCGVAEELVCQPDFLVREETGASCAISEEQVLASYSTDTPLNVPDTRVDDLQSQLLDLESAAARLRDQISMLQSSRAEIIEAQDSAEDMVLSGNYTFAELQGLAASVDVLAVAEETARREAMSQVMNDTANIVSEDIIEYIAEENARRIAAVANRTQGILEVQGQTLSISSNSTTP